MLLKGLRLIGSAGAVLAAVIGPAQGAEFCVTCEGPAAQYSCQFDDSETGLNESPLKLLCITELAKAGPHASCSVDRVQTVPCAGQVKHLALPEGMAPAIPQATQAAPGTPPAESAAPPAPPLITAPPRQPVGTGVAPPTGNSAVVPPPQPAQPPGQQQTAVPTDGKDAAPAGDAPAKAKAAPEGPPKTVQEMVEKGAKSTGKALEETGEVASDAAKKTGSALKSAGSAVGKAAKKTWNCITSLFSDC